MLELKIENINNIIMKLAIVLIVGEYKFVGIPIGSEFDIYVTKNNLTNENNISNEKLSLGVLTFIKDKTFKSIETTFFC